MDDMVWLVVEIVTGWWWSKMDYCKSCFTYLVSCRKEKCREIAYKSIHTEWREGKEGSRDRSKFLLWSRKEEFISRERKEMDFSGWLAEEWEWIPQENNFVLREIFHLPIQCKLLFSCVRSLTSFHYVSREQPFILSGCHSPTGRK
jgi:hypothetical protein